MQKTVNITYAPFASLVAVAAILVAVSDANGAVVATQTVDPASPAVAFDVQPGSYTVSAQAVDADTKPVGPAATATFSVDQPQTITVQIPSALAVE